MLKEVDADVAAKLNVTEDEKRKWQAIADNMYLPYDKERDIFLKTMRLDKDLKPVAGHSGKDQLPINQHWSWDKILRSPYVKQGDVIQGI